MPTWRFGDDVKSAWPYGLDHTRATMDNGMQGCKVVYYFFMTIWCDVCLLWHFHTCNIHLILEKIALLYLTYGCWIFHTDDPEGCYINTGSPSIHRHSQYQIRIIRCIMKSNFILCNFNITERCLLLKVIQILKLYNIKNHFMIYWMVLIWYC
jgi:hypothetical protein